MATRREVAAAIANAISAVSVANQLEQVEPRLVGNPTPPCVDIFPADPSEEDAAFGPTSMLQLWTIRARVTTADNDAGQDLLLDLMEPDQLREAVLTDTTLETLSDGLDLDPVSGFQEYRDPGGGGSLLGVQWRLRLFSKTGGVS